MSNENLTRWALLAEIIGGMAVIISLAVVAYELRQSTDQAVLNTAALEISTYQDLTNSISDLNSLLIQDEELAELFITGYLYPARLTQNERLRFNTYSINLIRHGDMAHYQYEKGTIDESRLNSVLTILTSRLNSSELVNQQWESLKQAGVFSLAYTDYVDALVAQSSLSVGDLLNDVEAGQ